MHCTSRNHLIGVCCMLYACFGLLGVLASALSPSNLQVEVIRAELAYLYFFCASTAVIRFLAQQCASRFASSLHKLYSLS
jgi:hypothetical protein